MAKKISVGIDIGTYQVKVVVAENSSNIKELPKVIGTGFAESKGLRHGYIINAPDVIKSLSQAIKQAEDSSGIRIRRAFLSVGGIGLGSIVSQGSIVISRADFEIDELDIKKVLEVCEKEIPPSFLLNRKIIHTIPLQYKLDGKIVLGKPTGMRGVKFEAKILFISCLERHLHDLIEAVEETGIEVTDVMASPLAASLVTLSKTQKIAGCVLANIGAETLSILVFENNLPISLEVFSMGSTDITNDIALGFKIPIDEAEHLKRGGISTINFPKKKLDVIIEARLSDMFELIETHLKKIGRAGLLPAGIIITGGGGGVSFIEDLAKVALHLPSKVAPLKIGDDAKSPFNDSSWSVAYGLCIFGLTADDQGTVNINNFFKNTLRKVRGLLQQFLP